MKKCNLFNEIIVVDRSALMRAIQSGGEFGITLSGEVVALPSEVRHIFIYQGKMTPPKASPLSPKQESRSLPELFGRDYRVVEDEERILLKVSGAWKSVMAFNLASCDYDDTTADGIADFPDETLEAIGWHATEFGIGYRDIVEGIESECAGTLLCIEQAEPYQFSGMGFIDDMECARRIAFDFCKKRIATLMAEDPDYAPDALDDDEAEAAAYFGLLPEKA